MPPNIDAVTVVLYRAGDTSDAIARFKNDRVNVGAPAKFQCGRQSRWTRPDEYRCPLLQVSVRCANWSR